MELCERLVLQVWLSLQYNIGLLFADDVSKKGCLTLLAGLKGVGESGLCNRLCRPGTTKAGP